MLIKVWKSADTIDQPYNPIQVCVTSVFHCLCGSRNLRSLDCGGSEVRGCSTVWSCCQSWAWPGLGGHRVTGQCVLACCISGPSLHGRLHAPPMLQPTQATAPQLWDKGLASPPNPETYPNQIAGTIYIGCEPHDRFIV